MKTVLITGTSCGVGRASAIKFLDEGYFVVGLDWKDSTINNVYYTHYKCDVSKADELPDYYGIDIIVNNAGIVTPQKNAIAVNQEGYINILEKYGNDENLKSLLIIGSTASQKGYDNIRYCSSQGARDAIMKWAANNYGKDSRHVIVNSLNLDGIVPAAEGDVNGTCMEPELYAHPELMEQIKDLSILKRLSTVKEIAEWVYFLTAINTVVTGQVICADGELMGAYKFIPYPGWDD